MKRLFPLFAFLTIMVLLILFLDRNRDRKEKTEVPPVEEETIVIQEVVKPTDSIPGDYRAWVSLTPAESKRLIAEGLMAYAPIVEHLEQGEILLCKGSTNHYIAESLFNGTLVHGNFLSGRITPKGSKYSTISPDQVDDIYFQNGRYVKGTLDDALAHIKKGAIIIKGGNILNYETKKVAVLAGSPTGGTTAKILPFITNKTARLIIPIGLEKNSSIDIEATVDKMQDSSNGIPRLFNLPGEVFTEIEAIKQFADVEVFQVASGGIGGAEGAVSLVIRGTEDNVRHAMKFVEAAQGEPPFFSNEADSLNVESSTN